MDVTVVIPVWDDYVRLLPRAVASVRATAPEAAILVVDNASRVGVPEDPDVTLIRSPARISVGAARNLGLASAKTAFVMGLDADDELLPGGLHTLAARMRERPELTLCVGGIVDAETGTRHRSPRPFVRRLVHWPRLFAIADTVWSLMPIQGCAVMRTDAAIAAGGYADASWGDDWVLAVSLAFRGRVELIEHPTRRYWGTPGSISGSVQSNRELLASAALVRERLRQDPGIPGWAKRLVVLIGALQSAALFLVRPPYLLARRISS